MHNTTLRQKTLLIFSLTIFGLLSLFYIVSQKVIGDSFAKLEKEHVRINVQRVLNHLSEERANLERITRDWAVWDATYAFIEDHNEEYIYSNIVETTFDSSGLRLNVLLYIDSAGQTVLERGFDFRRGKWKAIPQGLSHYLAPDGILGTAAPRRGKSGLLLLPGGPLLVASSPILTSSEEGPMRGFLIMARFLDAAEVLHWEAVTRLSITLHRLENSHIPSDVETALPSLSASDSILIHPLDGRAIAGYALLKDIRGEPILVLRVEMPREIYQQGQSAISYFILWILAGSLVFAVLALSLLNKTVLTRLSDLIGSVSRIGVSAELSVRVPVRGKDELSRLAKKINEMLERLERADTDLRYSQDLLESIVNAVPDIIYRLGADGNIVFINEQIKKYGYTPEELMGVNFATLVHPGDLEKAICRVNERRTGKRRTQFLEMRLLTKEHTPVHFEVNSECEKTCPILLVSAEGIYTSDKPQSETFKVTQGIARDITERRKAEQALREVERLRVLTETAGAAAHEINQPLTGLLTLLEMRLVDMKHKYSLQDDLRMMHEQAERIGAIVSQMKQVKRYATKPYTPGDNIVDFDA